MLHKQTKDCMEKSCLKTTIMECKPLTTKAVFYTKAKTPLGEICCQKKSDKLKNNNEITVRLMRRRTGVRLGEENRANFLANSCSVQEKTRFDLAICPSPTINRSRQKRSPQAWK